MNNNMIQTYEYNVCKIIRLLMIICVIPVSSYCNDGGKRVIVSNASPYTRNNAIAEITLRDLNWPVSEVDKNPEVINEDTKEEVISQLIDEDGDGVHEKLIFMSDFNPGEVKKFSVALHEGKAAYQSLVNAKYTLPRKDVAWENDRIAFRIYGSPLAGDVFNGIDVLVKRVRYQIIDKWYHGDTLKGSARISYHIDHGEGADFFLVGKSLGCGSTAILMNDQMYQAGLFSYYLIIANGPLRTIFEVYYPDIKAGDKKFLQVKKITLDAGSNMNKIEDLFISESSGILLDVVSGLVKRNGVSVKEIGDKKGISLWGPTDTDPINEFLGTGVLVPDGKLMRVYEDSVHVYALCSVGTGLPFTYYAGAGWTRSGDFKNVDDWNKYLENYLRIMETPLMVEINN